MVDLKKYADDGYKEFQSSLIPNLPKEKILGVRIPQLRKIAREFDQKDFHWELPHKYYDEYNLHALMINEMTDFNEVISRLQDLLPFVDNWATCDLIRPKAGDTRDYLPYINPWLESDHLYTRRFAIVFHLRNFTGDDYEKNFAIKVLSAPGDEYYLNMAKGWYLQQLTLNHPEEGLFMMDQVANRDVQKIARQKIRDSRMISQGIKDKLTKSRNL